MDRVYDALNVCSGCAYSRGVRVRSARISLFFSLTIYSLYDIHNPQLSSLSLSRIPVCYHSNLMKYLTRTRTQVLGSTPWTVNERVLDVVKHKWENCGGGVAALPRRADFEIPEVEWPERPEGEFATPIVLQSMKLPRRNL